MVAASAVLALIVAAAFLVLLLAIGDIRGSERRVNHSEEVLVASNGLERLLLDLETGQRGFVITHRERFLEPWLFARKRFPQISHSLLSLVEGNADEEKLVRRIANAERSYIDDYAAPLIDAARRNAPSASSIASAQAGKDRVDAMRTDFDELITSERQSVTQAQAQADDSARRAKIAAATALGGSILLIAMYAAYLTRSIVRPVRRASAMAERVAGGDLCARVPETGVAEIGALGRAFNVMGESLERSRDSLAALADEQSALRRVATLVAQAASPSTVFAAVAEEVAGLFHGDVGYLGRYDDGETLTVVGAWGGPALAARVPLGGRNVATQVRATGRPARIERYGADSGSLPSMFGIRSAVGAPITVEGRLWGVLVVAGTGDAPPQPGTELRLAHFTELVATAIANAEAQAELTASRARVVATADETRRRIERDLHDGAQQRLVSLALQLRSAQAAMPTDLREVTTQLDDIAVGLNRALEELREYARGIHPAILTEGGLGPALKTLARRSTVPVELDVRTAARMPQPVEVGAYYVVSEALANAAKHARASTVFVGVEADEQLLRIRVADDGVGGAGFQRGSGLVGLRDRVAALGGRMALQSEPGAGTLLTVELPLARDAAASTSYG